MKNLIYSFLIILISPAFTSTAQDKTFTLTIEISDISLNNTEVFVAIYNTEDSFKQKLNAVDSLKFYPESDTLRVIFTDIRPDNYAIAVFQDINGNGKLDTKGFNLPVEPFGISKMNPEGKMFIPTFRKTSIKINGDTTVLIPLISKKQSRD